MGPPSVDHSSQPIPETGHEGKIDVTVTYSVYGSGDIVADVEVNPDTWLPPLARVGLHMVVPKEMKVSRQSATWQTRMCEFLRSVDCQYRTYLGV